MSKSEWLQLTLVVVLSLLITFFVQSLTSPPELTTIGKLSYQLEIADKPSSRRLGLSGRDNLASDRGMLFVFDHVSDHGIWMKGMRFSLDIIWLDDNQQVVGLAAEVSPSSYPTILRATRPSQFVIELNAGQVALAELMIGDQIKIKLPAD